MKLKFFKKTDTLHIEFNKGVILESRDLDENMLLYMDADGNICGLTIEHTKQRADILHFSYEKIVA